GTFISTDPMARIPGWTGNALQFANGSPTVHNDPLGLSPTVSSDCAIFRWCNVLFIPGVAFEAPEPEEGNVEIVYQAMQRPLGISPIYRVCVSVDGGDLQCGESR